MQTDSTCSAGTGVTLEDARIGLLSCPACGALWFIDLDDDGNEVGWPSCPRARQPSAPAGHRNEGVPRHSGQSPPE